MYLAFWYTPTIGSWQIINEQLYVGLLSLLRQRPQDYDNCMLCLIETDAASAQQIDLSIIKPHPALHAHDEQHYDGPHS